MTDAKRLPVGDRLRAVRDAEALHTIMQELAANPRNRWTRAQVEFFLDKRFHGLLKRFYDGSALRTGKASAQRPPRITAPDLDAALAAVESLPKAQDRKERTTRPRAHTNTIRRRPGLRS